MTERHDFKQILADLSARGFGVNKIALRIGAQFVQIQRIKDGGRVSFDIGVALIELHREVCSTGNLKLTIVPQPPAIEMRMA